MVRLLSLCPLPVLVVLLVLPGCAANPLDGIVETTEPPVPLPVDPDHLVRINHAELDVGEGRLGLAVGTDLASMAIQLHCGPSDGGLSAACTGYLCAMGPGNGEMPVYFVADPGQLIFGVGVDPTAEEGQYGPYKGAMVSPGGTCGP